MSIFLAEDTGRLRFTDEAYAEFKRRHSDSTLPQDSAVFMKCGAPAAPHATVKTHGKPYFRYRSQRILDEPARIGSGRLRLWFKYLNMHVYPPRQKRSFYF